MFLTGVRGGMGYADPPVSGLSFLAFLGKEETHELPAEYRCKLLQILPALHLEGYTTVDPYILHKLFAKRVPGYAERVELLFPGVFEKGKVSQVPKNVKKFDAEKLEVVKAQPAKESVVAKEEKVVPKDSIPPVPNFLQAAVDRKVEEEAMFQLDAVDTLRRHLADYEVGVRDEIRHRTITAMLAAIGEKSPPTPKDFDHNNLREALRNLLGQLEGTQQGFRKV